MKHLTKLFDSMAALKMDKTKPIKVLIYCPRLLDTGGIESHLKEFISSIHSEKIQIIL
jgi:hypothetical protein